MTDEQAFRLLGLTSEASADDIHREWKRLVIDHHRNRGGAAGHWRDLNVARDVAIAAAKLRDAIRKSLSAVSDAIDRFAWSDHRDRDPNIERLEKEIHDGVETACATVTKKPFQISTQEGSVTGQLWVRLMRLENDAHADATDYRRKPERRADIWARHLARMTEAAKLAHELEEERKRPARERARLRRERKNT